MYKNIKTHLSQLLGAVTFTSGIMALYWTFKGFNEIESADFIIAIVLFLVHYVAEFPGDEQGTFFKKTIQAALFIPRNIFLLFLGQTNLLLKVKSIYENTEALYQTEIFANISGISMCRPGEYFIIYTHNKNSNNEHHATDDKPYKITGFPNDETETIMRVWYYVTSYLKLNWKNCQLSCSCQDALVGDARKKALSSSMAIIGSIKGNVFGQLLMENIKSLQQQLHISILPYIMETKIDDDTGDTLCYLHSQHKAEPDKLPSAIHPESTKRPESKKKLYDYAIIAKLPNIMNVDENDKITIDKDNCILFLAGCKTAGQITILKTLFNPQHMKELNEKYGNMYFYEIIEVKWNYIDGGLPRILAFEIKESNKINL